MPAWPTSDLSGGRWRVHHVLLGELLTIMPEDLPITIIVMATASSVLSTSNRRLPVWCRRTRTRRILTSAKLRRQCAFGDIGSLRQANSKGRLAVARAAKSSLLHVKVKPMQLVMPRSAGGCGRNGLHGQGNLHGKGHDVWEMCRTSRGALRASARTSATLYRADPSEQNSRADSTTLAPIAIVRRWRWQIP